MASRIPRTLRRFTRFALGALFCVAVVAGCSESASDLSDDELREELVRVMTEDGGIPTEQAGCIADTLFEDAPRDQINRLADAENLEDLSQEDSDVLFAVISGCL